MDWESILISLGVSLILIGITFILAPLIIKSISAVDLNKIPWFLLYVYRTDDIVLVTSPILIIIGVAFLLWTLLRR